MSIKILKDYTDLPNLRGYNGRYMGYCEKRFFNNNMIPDDTENGKCRWECFDCGSLFLKSYQLIFEGEWCNKCIADPIEKNVVLCMTNEQIINNYKFISKPIHIPVPGSSNLLKEKYPIIYSEIHPIKNGKLDVSKLTCGSDKKVWFLCNRHKLCGEHSYESSPNKRCLRRQECKYCFGDLICKCQSFLSNPILFEQFDQSLNPDVDPLTLTLNCGTILKWRCKGFESCTSECSEHIWKTSINHRNNGTICPFCAINSDRVCKCQSVYSNLLLRSQFCEELNPGVNIMRLRMGSNIKLKWRCTDSKTCTDECDEHIWTATVNDRTNGSGCPYCSSSGNGGSCRCQSFMNNPLLRKQFDKELNPGIDPWKFSTGSIKELIWKCKGLNTCTENCKPHIWKKDIYSRTVGKNCPYCSNGGGVKKVCFCKSLCNNLLLKSEFDIILNIGLNPIEISHGSNIRTWWKCIICSHKWKTAIYCRTGNYKSGCPQCASKQKESFGHRNLRLYLNNKFINHAGEYKLVEYLPTRRYDFYLNDLGYFLEFDGEQHFRRCQWDDDEEDFLQRQQVDIYKTFVVLIQSSYMIRIQNKEYDDIQEVMEKFLSVKIDKPTLFLDNKIKYSYLFGKIDHEYLQILSGDKYNELADKIENLDYGVVYYDDLI